MIIKEYRIGNTPSYMTNFAYNIDKILYFDIETTGFSSKNNFIYLIGACYYKDNSYYITQWFSEDVLDEVNIIKSFFKFLQGYDLIIHYNGQSFDVPFIEKKLKFYNLDYNFSHLHSKDIYRDILKIKNLIKLENYKLKTVEKFFNICRKDELSASELTNTYKSYVTAKKLEDLKVDNKKESDKLLYKLLLHNEEDLIGLLYVQSIYAYIDLFNSPIYIMNAYQEADKLVIKFDFKPTLPISLFFDNQYFTLDLSSHYGILTVFIRNQTLKFFYEDYKNYYYLIKEDLAIHKSIASFVDSKFKEKAKPSTSYTKKQAYFIPLFNDAICPYFKYNYDDKINYIEVTDDFFTNKEILILYIRQILDFINK